MTARQCELRAFGDGMISPERTGLAEVFLGQPARADRRAAGAGRGSRPAGRRQVAAARNDPRRPASRRCAAPPGSDRTPTPLRLFCLPFEDLFTTAPRKTQSRRAASRAAASRRSGTGSARRLLPEANQGPTRRTSRPLIVAGKHADAQGAPPNSSGRSPPRRCAMHCRRCDAQGGAHDAGRRSRRRRRARRWRCCSASAPTSARFSTSCPRRCRS